MIYCGLGLLAVGIYGVVFFLFWLASLLLTNDSNCFFDNLLISFSACAFSALSAWLIGRWMNSLNPLQALEYIEGERRLISTPRHTIYTLEMEYWGIIFAAVTFSGIVAKKLGFL